MFCGECGRPVNTRGGRSPKGAARGAAQDAAPAEPAVEQPVEAEPVAEGEPAAVEPVEVAPVAQAPEPAVEAEPVAELAADSASAPEPAEPEIARAETPRPESEPEPVAEAQPAPAASPLESSAHAVAEDAPAPISEIPVAEQPAAPVAAAEPEAALGAPTERCAQCGAPLAASDIFCPECGFVRQRESARVRRSDTNVLDPFPWGLPRSTEPVPHQHAPGAFEPEEPARSVVTDASAKPFAEVADVAETRLVPRGARGERYVLQFSTGESVSVSGAGLIGRNPVAEPGEYFDTLVAIVDPGRSVSKTHLEFGQDGTSFWVSDRYSGNGTVVREPDREPRRCEAGKRYRVVRGARVEIGEQFFIVS